VSNFKSLPIKNPNNLVDEVNISTEINDLITLNIFRFRSSFICQGTSTRR